MALSKKSKIALGLLGAAAVTGAAFFLVQPRSRKTKKTGNGKAVCPPGQVSIGTDTSGATMCAPASLGDAGIDLSSVDLGPLVGRPPRLTGGLLISQQFTPTKDEPVGGWPARWDEMGQDAIEWCRLHRGKDLEGQIWPAFWNCVIERVFPETAVYKPEDRPGWWLEAANQIRQDIMMRLADEELSTQGWKFRIWLKFDHYIEDCYDALAPHTEGVAHCMASAIYPTEKWTPAPTQGWKAEFWNALIEKIDAYEEAQMNFQQ